MNKLILKNYLAKIIAVVFLCLSFFSFSAFTYQKESKYLTRLELAILFEQILDDSSIKIEQNASLSFSDLSKDQFKTIEKVMKCKLMEGYPDNTFRPNQALHNLEVISYLQKLTEYLRNNKPNTYQAKQLFRFLSYSEDPTIAFEYSPQNFPKGLEQPNGYTPKSFSKDILNLLTSSQNEASNFVFSGKIIDSINNKPVGNAYVSANNKAIAAETDGKFSFVLSNDTKTADIFAAADGYQPMEIRKDLKFSRNIIIRLKPIVEK